MDIGTGTVLDVAAIAPDCPAKSNIPVKGMGPGPLTRKSTTEYSGGITGVELEPGAGSCPRPRYLRVGRPHPFTPA